MDNLGKRQFLEQGDLGELKVRDADTSPLQARIRDRQENKIKNQQLISEKEKEITILDGEIQKLIELDLKLRKIYRIKNFKSLGSALEVSLLCNKITFKDLVERLNELLESNFIFSLEQMKVANLTIFQGLYLLFSDELSQLDSNSPDEDTKSETSWVLDQHRAVFPEDTKEQ